jgi:hypothetical protein
VHARRVGRVQVQHDLRAALTRGHVRELDSRRRQRELDARGGGPAVRSGVQLKRSMAGGATLNPRGVASVERYPELASRRVGVGTQPIKVCDVSARGEMQTLLPIDQQRREVGFGCIKATKHEVHTATVSRRLQITLGVFGQIFVAPQRATESRCRGQREAEEHRV